MQKNKTSKKIFDHLNILVQDSNNTFFRSDIMSSMQTKFAIFSYHVAQYSDWLEPYALESRGIMFELDENDNPTRIACRPPAKFFNYKENPFTENIESSEVQYLFKKEDGSLISTFLDKGELFVKSKTQLFSQQALDAQKWLYDERRRPLLKALKEYTELGYTVNMEWCSPDNRIVLDYEEPTLIILNIRHNETGEYIDYYDLLADGQIAQFLVEQVDYDGLSKTLESLESLEQEEGYVGWVQNKPYFKLKCPWYVHLHSVKSSVSSDKNLWEAVANGVSDDIKALFQTDQNSLDRISLFEQKYKNSFNLVYNITTEVYNKLQGYSRKDYAIDSQTELNSKGYPEIFSIVMRMYLTGPDENTIDLIKDHLIKYREKYLDE